MLKRARTDVAVTDARYPDFQYVAADWARRNNRNEEAEAILREFYSKNDKDQRARLALARLLATTGDPAKLDEAIDILSRPVEYSSASGPTVSMIREQESQTLLDLTSFRVTKYPSQNPAQAAVMMKQIEETYGAAFRTRSARRGCRATGA